MDSILTSLAIGTVQLIGKAAIQQAVQHWLPSTQTSAIVKNRNDTKNTLNQESADDYARAFLNSRDRLAMIQLRVFSLNVQQRQNLNFDKIASLEDGAKSPLILAKQTFLWKECLWLHELILAFMKDWDAEMESDSNSSLEQDEKSSTEKSSKEGNLKEKGASQGKEDVSTTVSISEQMAQLQLKEDQPSPLQAKQDSSSISGKAQSNPGHVRKGTDTEIKSTLFQRLHELGDAAEKLNQLLLQEFPPVPGNTKMKLERSEWESVPMESLQPPASLLQDSVDMTVLLQASHLLQRLSEQMNEGNMFEQIRNVQKSDESLETSILLSNRLTVYGLVFTSQRKHAHLPNWAFQERIPLASIRINLKKRITKETQQEEGSSGTSIESRSDEAEPPNMYTLMIQQSFEDGRYHSATDEPMQIQLPVNGIDRMFYATRKALGVGSSMEPCLVLKFIKDRSEEGPTPILNEVDYLVLANADDEEADDSDSENDEEAVGGGASSDEGHSSGDDGPSSLSTKSKKTQEKQKTTSHSKMLTRRTRTARETESKPARPSKAQDQSIPSKSTKSFAFPLFTKLSFPVMETMIQLASLEQHERQAHTQIGNDLLMLWLTTQIRTQPSPTLKPAKLDKNRENELRGTSPSVSPVGRRRSQPHTVYSSSPLARRAQTPPIPFKNPKDQSLK